MGSRPRLGPTDGGRSQWSFVGRDAELLALQGLLDRKPGGPWVAAVDGPAGIGKTRLLRELADRATAAGVLVLTGQAGEFEQAVPFGCFLDVLELLAEDTPVRSGLEQRHLYRRCRAALTALTRQRPVLLVMEDVHWADDASVGLLEFLLRTTPDAPLTLVMSYRSGQCPKRLAWALASAPAPAARIRVPPLARPEVDLLLPWLRPVRRRQLTEASAGNPLYLSLLAGLPADTIAALAEPTPLLGTEAILDHRIGAELGSLPAHQLLVAEATAVGGNQAGVELIAAIAALPEDEVLVCVDALTARGVLTTHAERFTFAHPLLRAAAYQLAGPGWRISAHRRAAAHLSRIGAPLMVRAQHLEHTVAPGDRHATGVLVEAAIMALASAPATSAHWLTVALAAVPAGTGTWSPGSIRLLLGRALLASGDLARAGTVLHELLADPDAPRVETLALLAQCERIRGRPAAAYVLLGSEGRRAGPAAGRVVVELATLDLMDGRIQSGMRRAHELARLAERADAGVAIGAAASILTALAAVGCGDATEALAGLAEAAAHLDAIGDGELRTILDAVLPALAWAAYLLERHELALRQLGRGIRVARAHAHSYALPHLYAAQACALTRQGRLAEAIEAAEDAEENARAYGAPDMLAIAASVRLRSQLWMSGPAGLHEQWLAACRLPEPAAEWFRLSVATILLDVGLQLPAPPPPDIVARLGLDHVVQRDPMLATRYALAAEAALANGCPADAQRWCALAVEAGERMGLPGQLGVAVLARARVGLAGGAHRAAATDGTAAAELFGRAGMPVQQGQALLAATEAATQLGDLDLATTSIATARALFAATGAQWLDGIARRAQRRLAARQPRPRNAGLSARESQVAELVAQGLTNRAIAERLYLSPRTVDTHLSRVLAKLGVTSRAGIARRLPASQTPDLAEPVEQASHRDLAPGA